MSEEETKPMKLEDGELEENANIAEVKIVDEVPRERWSRKIEFLFACIGFCVGYGNIWRFPYMCFKNGGGAFLIPYVLFLALVGVPLYFLELSVGQFTQCGPIKAWTKICPLSAGIGYASVVISYIVSVYYNVIMTWALYYFYNAFKKDIPWVGCHHSWNTDDCYVHNASNVNGSGISPSREFFVKDVLKITSGIDEPGPLNTPVAVCLLVAWVMVYFCIWKGIRTTGKVVYVTATAPYIVIVIFLIRGCTLPGAIKGIEYYLIPKWERLADAKVWVDAASQILYSLAIGFGVHLTWGSYNPRKNNVLKDALTISLINCATSVVAGFAIFSIVGFMAEQQGKTVPEVASQGPGLVFIVYPAAIAQLPIPQLWAVLFFFMLIMLGLDSQFGQVEVVSATVMEHYPNLRKRKELVVLVVCVSLFLTGFSCVTYGGIYVFNLFDAFSCGLSLMLVALFELLVVGWAYGARRFTRDLEVMTQRGSSLWWVITWKFVSIFVTAGIFLFYFFNYGQFTYEKYVYPTWAEVIGWMMALASILCIPGVALFKIITSYRKGTRDSLTEVVRDLLFVEDEEWLKEKKLQKGGYCEELVTGM